MTGDLRKNWEASWRSVSASAEEKVGGAESLERLEAVRLEFLGRKGSLTELLKQLKDLPLEDRRQLGGPANELKAQLEAAIEAKQKALGSAHTSRKIAETRLDPTLPASGRPLGHLHPLTVLTDEMVSILSRLGFTWADGPQVEKEHYNFDALNIPADHPARDMQDTFFVDMGGGKRGDWLLRTHTSPVQIRRMESSRPPLRIMAPGRVFRHEAVDASHSAVFHQIEGLYVDKNVTLADLKGTLNMFLQAFFGPQTKTRFRPSYFPFTEPSAQVDISCLICGASGCGVCKKTGWLEVMGAGLVHPNVFRAVDYDPSVWSGFAFGLGVERMAMLKCGINDIRLFYQNDARFLEQFG